MQERNIYWLGNSAKTKIINNILDQVKTNQEVVVFDYGCGTGGDWPSILTNYPNIRFIGYEPSKKSFQIAEEKLSNFNAELLTSEAIYQAKFKADFIVSFSVFEHVHDRELYLKTAKNLLSEHGLFYLNYDDGHFRNYLNLNQPNVWFTQLKEWFSNFLAEPLASVGIVSTFQKRVNSSELNELVNKVGFYIIDDFYSNLSSFKSLSKTFSSDKQQDFACLWLEIEEILNTKFRQEGRMIFGETTNLWQQMASRTLILHHI